MITLGFACDHAGYELKEELVNYVLSLGYGVKDYGCYSSDSVDYPDFAHALAFGLKKGECGMGIALCGSANGISITLNKHADIRAAICPTAELAMLARQHNDANVLSLPARYITLDSAKEVVNSFLSASFDGGRHLKRVEKINL